ncbi:MAG: hypothetical protein ACRC5A_16885, partial [Enterobacteriaceae bacterium]
PLQETLAAVMNQIEPLLTLFASLVPSDIARRTQQALDAMQQVLHSGQNREQLGYSSHHLALQLAVSEWCYHASHASHAIQTQK